MRIGFIRRYAGSMAVVFAIGMAASPAFGVDPAKLNGKQVAALWDQGCNAVVRGDFGQATDLLTKVRESNPAETKVKQITDWLGDYNELLGFQDENRIRDYERHVTRAKERFEADFLRLALWHMRKAYVVSKDQDAFVQEEWVQAIVKKARTDADELLEKQKWVLARNIYLELETVFSKDKELREAREKCNEHVRIEALYGPHIDWEEAVRGIEPKMVDSALWRVERNYVEEPDLKKIAEGAIQNLLLLAETKPLQKTFEQLKNPTDVGQFVGRLTGRLARVRGQRKLTSKDVREHFNRILEINNETVQLPQEVIINEFVEGALSSTDKFSSMIWPSEVDEFKKHTVGRFPGIGIQISRENGALRVVSPLEDTPAFRAGLQPDDVITTIDGKSAKDVTLQQAVNLITGPEGTEVTLGIRRESEGVDLEFTIARATINIQTIKGWKRNEETEKWDFMADPEMKVGYIRMTSFMENTVEEMRASLEKMDKDGLRGLILDLRFNPGGLLRAAVEAADLFLPGEKLIVSTKGRSTDEWKVSSKNRGSYPDLPLILLINDYSASASEIVAGAIQDHKRGLIIGERSFGKGSVQNLINIDDSNAFLKLTTALYYLPNGRCLHRMDDDVETWGVDPDVQEKLLPMETRKVIAMRRESDIIHGMGQKTNPAPNAKAEQDQADETRPTRTPTEEVQGR